VGLFDSKVVVVTGAGGGIGREHAVAFAREGAQVVVNDLGVARDGTGAGTAMAQQVADEIVAAGGNAVADMHSVSETEGAEGMIQTAIDSFGRLDVLVNNAGILRDRTIVKMSDEEWDLVQAVHLRGTFLCLRAACRVMIEQGEGGAIVNTSSTSGLFGNYGQGNYGAAKAGIAGLTRTAALEMTKHSIRVNALVPVALTRMTEDLAVGTSAPGPEWIPPVVLYLSSDLATSVTGRIFGSEGGKVREYYYESTAGIDRTDRPWTPQEIAESWKDVVRRSSGGADVSEGDLDALVLVGLPAGIDAAKAQGWNARIHVELIDGDDGYTLNATNGRLTTRRGLHGKPTCVLTTDTSTAYGVFRGELDGTQAYMTGKLKISNVGDMMAFTDTYDAQRAKEAQAEAGELVEHSEELTPSGLNAAAVGAELRGQASLLLPQVVEELTAPFAAEVGPGVPLLTGCAWTAPLLAQGLATLGEPEVTDTVRLCGLEIDRDEPIAMHDLLYPVLVVDGLETDAGGDLVTFTSVVRRSGEVVEQHRWLGCLGAPELDNATVPDGEPAWTTELKLDQRQAEQYAEAWRALVGPDPVAPLAWLEQIIRELQGQQLVTASALSKLNVRFHQIPQPGTAVQLQLWSPTDAPQSFCVRTAAGALAITGTVTLAQK
jgi:NAD(P)-dependent dehydrogenase (short-subunit alcohol dehydrogenase family)/putative sterol carrier protein